MDIIKAIESEYTKENAVNFEVGNTVKVYLKIMWILIYFS